jgi:RNA polymerase sigma-70 factor (ECF subfamily)
MNNEDKKILARISKNDRHVLNKLYPKYREAFLNQFKNYQLPEEEVIAIYQDSMIACYQNGVQGKLEGMEDSIEKYVFGIGKHKIMNVLEEKSINIDVPSAKPTYEAIDLKEKALNTDQKSMHKKFSKLDESCQRMLRLYYYRRLSLEEIKKMENYKDVNTVNSKKSKCLKKLRAAVNK